MDCKVTITITDNSRDGEDLHDIDIETEGIEADDLPNLFDYLTPKITMRHKINNKTFQLVE